MIDYLTIFLSLIVSALAIYYFFMQENYFDKHGIPHAKLFTIIWYMASAILCRRDTFLDPVKNLYHMKEDAKYIGLLYTTAPALMIRDLELLKEMAIKNFDHFTDHDSYSDPKQEPLLRKNLLFLQGDKWRKTRNILSPAFTLSKMRAMLELIVECAETFSNSLQGQCIDQAMEYDSRDIFSRYANDVMATCVFGIAVDSMKNPNNEFYVYGRRATNVSGINGLKVVIVKFFPTLTKIFGLKIVDTEAENFFSNLVRDIIAARDEQAITRPDMIQLMMEARDKDNLGILDLSIESMAAHAFVFYFGGLESTTTLLCFVAHHIAVYPDVQGKIRNEIDQVMASCNGKPTYEAFKNMVYLDAVINETLRLYPGSIMADRVCTKSFELPPSLPECKPASLKPGDTVFYPIAPMHRDPKYFPRPDEFHPERFIGDSRAENNFNAYLPFGLGPRKCLGNRFALLETKVLFFHLLTKFDITPGDKMILPMRLSKKSLTYMAEGGFWVNFKPIKKFN